MWWCSILLRRANIEGEVWLIMSDYIFFKGGMWGCAPEMGFPYYWRPLEYFATIPNHEVRAVLPFSYLSNNTVSAYTFCLSLTLFLTSSIDDDNNMKIEHDYYTPRASVVC